MKSRTIYFWAWCALALLGLIFIMPVSQTAAQAQTAPAGGPVLIPGGVIDPNGQTAYLANTVHNGISAIDLATGKILWQAPGPWKPILVTGQKLIAWRSVEYAHNALRVWALDTRTGRSSWSSALVVLPSSVFVDSDSPVKPPFFVTGRMQNGQLELLWNVPASTSRETTNVRAQSGVVGVDLQTGAMVKLAASSVVARPEGWVSKAIVGSRAYYLVEKKSRGDEEETQPLVRAVDRKSGKTLWEFPLGEP